ncbi:MAG: hypothetical protein BIFFINMI_02898 [Phycisphaerae bacterium]|nr:hypothetical protein [Phycisphaerae bacterium]
MKTPTGSFVLIAGVLAVAQLGAPVRLMAAPPPAGGTTLLDAGSFWRVYASLRPPYVIGEKGKDGQPAIMPIHVDYRTYPGIERLASPLPSADWAATDFDDREWPRLRVASRAGDRIGSAILGPGISYDVFSLSLRGKFNVTDPSAVGSLTLSLQYVGGAVVCLNGREVARQDLPAGELGPDTPGAAYPDEAFGAGPGSKGPASRVRSLAAVKLPASALRKGVNVLAIHLRRSDYNAVVLRSRWGGACPLGIEGVTLTADGGAQANTDRPPGAQVFNHDVNDRVCLSDYGDPCELLAPIRLAGARNGVFSGQVVVSSPSPIKGLKVTAEALKTPAGGTIAPAAVEFRYGVLDGHGYSVPDWFDGLTATAPGEAAVTSAKAAMVPVWVMVHVPADASGGVYSGAVTISYAGAAPVRVPVELSVADWTLPDPRKFQTYVGIYQSPTSVAMQYGVKEWSPEHWKLVEKSFDLLAQLGNKLVIVPIVDRTQFGNPEGMVTWIRKPDGGYDYDFTVFDRYMAMVDRVVGKQDFVALQVWHSGGWEMRKADQQNSVTVVDQKTGAREHMQVPVFGTEESKKFFKPVLDEARKHLEKVGMADAMCLGILSDGTAPPEVFREFAEIAPGVGWMRGCHSGTNADDPYTLVRGCDAKVVCHEFCYGMGMADPAKGLPPIWKFRTRPGVAYIRHNFDDTLSLLKYRNMTERAVYCQTRGLGRICLDFWDVLPTRGGKTVIYNRYPESSCAQRAPSLYRLSCPAEDGAAATVRFELLREGLQEVEALMVVAQAAGEQADRLGPELAARCRQVYLDRLNYARWHAPESYGMIYLRSDHQDWRELAARTYQAAADARKALAQAGAKP